MNKWLVVHDLESFRENPRMIGFVGKRNLDGSPTLDSRGNPLPADPKVLELKPGDVVVYYCRGDSVIKGLYEVVQACYKSGITPQINQGVEHHSSENSALPG